MDHIVEDHVEVNNTLIEVVIEQPGIQQQVEHPVDLPGAAYVTDDGDHDNEVIATTSITPITNNNNNGIKNDDDDDDKNDDNDNTVEQSGPSGQQRRDDNDDNNDDTDEAATSAFCRGCRIARDAFVVLLALILLPLHAVFAIASSACCICGGITACFVSCGGGKKTYYHKRRKISKSEAYKLAEEGNRHVYYTREGLGDSNGDCLCSLVSGILMFLFVLGTWTSVYVLYPLKWTKDEWFGDYTRKYAAKKRAGFL